MLVRRGLRVAGLKPVASGCRMTPQGLRNEDAEALMCAANVILPYEVVNTYAFAAPVAPHWAAQELGVVIDPDQIERSLFIAAQGADYVVVEGAGGFLLPLNPACSYADLVARLALPVILVVGLRLGAINHALLSAEAILCRGLCLAGWVVNQSSPTITSPGVVESLQALLPAPCLGVLPWQDGEEAWRGLSAYLDLSPLVGP